MSRFPYLKCFGKFLEFSELNIYASVHVVLSSSQLVARCVNLLCAMWQNFVCCKKCMQCFPEHYNNRAVHPSLKFAYVCVIHLRMHVLYALLCNDVQLHCGIKWFSNWKASLLCKG